MFLTLLQFIYTELLIVLTFLFRKTDTFLTIYLILFALQLFFGGIIWYVSSRLLNRDNRWNKKAFKTPIILMGICVVTILILLATAFIPPFSDDRFATTVICSMASMIIPLSHIIIYLLCYGIQWLISKLPRKPKEKNKKSTLIFYYIAKVFSEYSYLLLIVINYINELVSKKHPNIDLNIIFEICFFGIYVLEITIGGLIWYLIYRYAIKNALLSKKKAFFIPIGFMAVSVIIGLLLPSGEEFKYLSNALAIFPQISQFVVYLLSFLVADIILILKYHIAKRKQKRETN